MGCGNSVSKDNNLDGTEPESMPDEPGPSAHASEVAPAVALTPHAERARMLGISQSELPGTPLIPEHPPEPTSIRVMQWNLLASGMAHDGFLVNDVLDETNATESGLGPASDLQSVLEEVRAAKRSKLDMAPLQEKFSSSRSKRNLEVMVDWDLRWARMKEVIAIGQPDVITCQELDKMTQVQAELAELGYECSLSPARKYSPVHKVVIPPGKPSEYIEHLKSVGVSFAPNAKSTCRKLGLASDDHADDDGVAIFWKGSALQADQIDFLPYKGTEKEANDRYAAMIHVTLTRKSDKLKFNVCCAHLSSGDSEKDEAERLHDLTTPLEGFQSPIEWLQGIFAKESTVFCLDANTAPGRKEPATVWKLLRGITGVQSVWDKDYTPDGAVLCLPAPVTTNKMRGPLSGQAKKIGEHMCHIIDHVFFTEGFEMQKHALNPLLYDSDTEACSHLLPSLAIPSDHAPVVVDFSLQLVSY